VSVHAVRLAAEKAKSLDGVKMARAMADLELPPEVSLMKGNVRYRAGDHQLMSNLFVGQMHPPEGDPDNFFKEEAVVTGEEAAGTVESTGCKMVWPS
jgi:branched-chain amino acid transport system substrate-binding protein